ncbi:claudin-24 [Brachyhypopomus gauderio]|uniref:claudin-24 n=1 Tax=Brachyhypopomus gauderio TaxID=698409 RepID=UPI00404111A4
MSNPCASALELLGLLVEMVAWFCSLATTLMPQWLSTSTELLVIESYELGLWETCVVQEVAGTECRAYETLLGLPFNILLSRAFMCVSDAMGLLGLLVVVPGLKQVKCCTGHQGRRVKRGVKITAGVICMLAGVMGLIPVSYIAHETVVRFFDESTPHIVPRWEFGDALFIGWAAGFLHILAALLFFASCLGSTGYEPRLVYHHDQGELATVKSSSSKLVEYV